MRSSSLFLLLGVLVFSWSAQANLSVVCTAKGKKTASSGQMLLTDARVEFDVQDFDASTDKVMTIQGVRGEIKVGAIDTEALPLDNDNAYVGVFNFEELKSNPKYKPTTYRNMVQFKDFDAEKTTGLEDGMWGNFLIDKNLGDGCEAKYVFQAGDHMGGTVHLTCSVQD
jgi:hypothetical protein